jgi:hypothetical protein
LADAIKQETFLPLREAEEVAGLEEEEADPDANRLDALARAEGEGSFGP